MKKAFVALCLCVLAFSVSAQQIYNSSGRKTPKKPAKKSLFSSDNLIIGGDVRMSFGGGLNLGLAPIVGLKFNDVISAGVRVGYGYTRYQADLPAGFQSNLVTANSYCGGIWGRVMFLENLFVHIEPQYVFYDQPYLDYNNYEIAKKKMQSSSMFIGGGIRQPISDRASMNLTILYDILSTDKNNYYYQMNGIDVRIGFLVGF
jgi:hypothetical protein